MSVNPAGTWLQSRLLLWACLSMATLATAVYAYANFGWFWQLSQDSMDPGQALDDLQLAWLGWELSQAYQLPDFAAHWQRSRVQNAWLMLASLSAWLALWGLYRCWRLLGRQLGHAANDADLLGCAPDSE